MRIVIAVDKFKGSLAGAQVAAALERGLRSELPEVQFEVVPVADGGEGTLLAALDAGFEARTVQVTGPLGRPVMAQFGVRRSGSAGAVAVAVVELAQASGIELLTPAELDPLGATTFGTGESILAALDVLHGPAGAGAGAGAPGIGGADWPTVILGVGGSATTDGGAGLLQALGARLLDADGLDVAPGGGALAGLVAVDLRGLDPRVARTRFVLAADVDNPLTGPRGAAAVFSPQKGADSGQVQLLDSALGRFADLLEGALVRGEVAGDSMGVPERRFADRAGAGAAGGVGFAALAALGAQRQRGVDVVLGFTGLEQVLADADAVITGEGSLDAQSLEGKAPIGVAELAGRLDVPVFGVCGRNGLDEQQIARAGFRQVVALMDLAESAEDSMNNAAVLLIEAGRRIGRVFAAGENSRS